MTRRRYLRSGLAVSLMLAAAALAGNAAALATSDDPWAPAIQQVDSALARKEDSAALRAATTPTPSRSGPRAGTGCLRRGSLSPNR